MLKPQTTNREPGKPGRLDLKGILSGVPLLVTYLHDDLWDDGTPRTRATMSVFIEEGVIKVCVNDREFSRSLYVTGDTLELALRGMEKLLERGENADWRKWKATKKKG